MNEYERVVQSFELIRSSSGWIPVARLTTTTEPPEYTTQSANWFGVEQVQQVP